MTKNWTKEEVLSAALRIRTQTHTKHPHAETSDMLTAFASRIEADERAKNDDVLRASLVKALMDYRCSRTVDEDGECLPLVDALSPGEGGTIQSGIEEIEILAEHLMAEWPYPPAQAPHVDACHDRCQRIHPHCQLRLTRDIAPDSGWHWHVQMPDGHLYDNSHGPMTFEKALADMQSRGIVALDAADIAWRSSHAEAATPGSVASDLLHYGIAVSKGGKRVDPRDMHVRLPAQAAQVVITKNEAGQIVAVTRQDDEGRILEVLAESTAEPVAQGEVRCQYCDGTGDVHGIDGEWRGTCTECPAAMEQEFKNFHRQLCERFGYTHDEKDWRRDQVSLIEFMATQPHAVPDGWALVPEICTDEMISAGECQIELGAGLPGAWERMVANRPKIAAPTPAKSE